MTTSSRQPACLGSVRQLCIASLKSTAGSRSSVPAVAQSPDSSFIWRLPRRVARNQRQGTKQERSSEHYVPIGAAPANLYSTARSRFSLRARAPIYPREAGRNAIPPGSTKKPERVSLVSKAIPTAPATWIRRQRPPTAQFPVPADARRLVRSHYGRVRRQ